MKLNDFKNAVEDCNSAIERQEDYTKAYMRRCVCAQCAPFVCTITWICVYSTARQSDVFCQSRTRAACYMGLEDYEEAVRDYERVQKLEPDNEGA